MFNDKLFDAILQQAVKDDLDNEIAAIPSDDELKKMYNFSDRHNRRMKKLFSTDKRREVFGTIPRWGIAASFALIAVAAIITNPLINPFYNRNNIKPVSIKMPIADEIPLDVKKKQVGEAIPAYVPAGYEITRIYIYPDSYVLIDYANDAGEVFLIEVSYYYDSDNVIDGVSYVREVDINGNKGYLYNPGWTYILSWRPDNAYGEYSVRSNSISPDELIKIAESIKCGDVFG